MKTQYPDNQQCLAILQEYGTPSHVIGHCKAVSMVAVTVAKALNCHGFSFDVEIIRFAGMLHDIARKSENHHIVGADYLQQLGYPEAAKIVRAHMKHPIVENLYDSTETDIMCLGDRTVLESRYVGIDLRMEYIIDKARKFVDGDIAKVEAGIRKNFQQLKKYVCSIEEIIGMPMDQLIANAEQEAEGMESKIL